MSEAHERFDELDSDLDYTDTLPSEYGTKWIADENLRKLAEIASEEAFGDPDHEAQYAVVAVLNNGESEDWMASEYGSSYWALKGEVEEQAKMYREIVFADELDGGEN